MRLGFGVDLAIHHLATELVHRGHSVTVWAVFSDGTYERQSYTLRIYPVGLNLFQPVYDIQAIRRLRVLDEKADLWVITHPLAVLCRFLKPCVFYDFGLAPPARLGLREHFNYFYRAFLDYFFFISGAEKIFTVSTFLQSRLPPFLRRKSVVLYIGVDHYPKPDASGVNEWRQKLSPESKPIVLYVGRLNSARQPYKGVQELLQHYEALQKDAVLVMAGYGEEEDEKFLRERGVAVFRCARVDWMPYLFSASDVYASCSQWEGFDLPMMEAAYLGKPCVVYNRGAHSELVKDGITGFLCTDEASFHHSLVRLLKDKALREKMGREAGEHAASFTWRRTAEIFLASLSIWNS